MLGILSAQIKYLLSCCYVSQERESKEHPIIKTFKKSFILVRSKYTLGDDRKLMSAIKYM